MSGTDEQLDADAFSRIVQARYSCYAFDATKPVDDEVLKQCLELTRAAPRVKNTQPWTAIVVRSADVRAKLLEAVDKVHRDKVASAPVCIVFAAAMDEQSVLTKNTPDFLRAALPGLMGNSAEAWAFKQTSFAAAVFMLAATAHGLQTCAMERFVSSTAVAEVVGLPSTFSVPLLVAVGHEAERRVEKGEGADFKQAVARLYLDGYASERGYSTKPGVTNPVKLRAPGVASGGAAGAPLPKGGAAGTPARPATAPQKGRGAEPTKVVASPQQPQHSSALPPPSRQPSSAMPPASQAQPPAETPSSLPRPAANAKQPSSTATSRPVAGSGVSAEADDAAHRKVAKGAGSPSPLKPLPGASVARLPARPMSAERGTHRPEAATETATNGAGEGPGVLSRIARRLSWRRGDAPRGADGSAGKAVGVAARSEDLRSA